MGFCYLQLNTLNWHMDFTFSYTFQLSNNQVKRFNISQDSHKNSLWIPFSFKPTTIMWTSEL